MKNSFFVVISLFLVLTVFGKDLTNVEEIVKKANLVAYYAGKDGKAKVDMTIVDSSGRKRTRSFIILRKNIELGGDQYYYVYFKKPADVRKMVYMVYKHPGKDDDRWLYKPSLDLIKRIAAGDKRSSFVGSHFVYEDVSGRSIYDDIHKLIKTTDRFYVVKNIPKDKNLVEFSYYIVYIDKKTFLPMKAEFFDKQGNKYKVIEALEVKDIQGHPTVIKSKATDLQRGGYTLNIFSKIKYDIGLPDRIFTEKSMRRAPRRYLR